MNKLKILGILVAAVAAIMCWQRLTPPASARLKVENDGGGISGGNQPAANALLYDPCFIHVIDTPHLNFKHRALGEKQMITVPVGQPQNSI